ncbi:MAG: hypothetical protein AAFY69_00480 [Pseudomonadota bacterium]
METRISATGWPLTIAETMQLKLAAAIIAQPKVLVLSQLFDTMTGAHLTGSLDTLSREGNTTVLYFSNRQRNMHFDHYLYLGYERQTFFDDYPALCAETGYDKCDPTPVTSIPAAGGDGA